MTKNKIRKNLLYDACKNNDKLIVECILKKNKEINNERFEESNIPLHITCQNGCFEMDD